MMKVKERNVKKLAQGRTAYKWWSKAELSRISESLSVKWG